MLAPHPKGVHNYLMTRPVLLILTLSMIGCGPADQPFCEADEAQCPEGMSLNCYDPMLPDRFGGVVGWAVCDPDPVCMGLNDDGTEFAYTAVCIPD